MPTAEDSANLTAEQVRELQITDDQDEGQFFANKQVNVKLDDYNFLLWKQQVILMIRGHDLEHFLDESTPVPTKVITNSSGQLAINPAYRRFRKQDSSLAPWLLSTISPGILPQLVGSETTAGIWSSVIKLYSKLSTTKIMSLHCKLRSMKKGTSTVSEYTTHIKEICDLLATTGSPVSEIEQIATILNGLPAEYEAFIAALTDERSKAILMEGRLEDGLYCFSMHSSSNSAATECHHTTSTVAVDSCDANNTVLKPSSHATYWLWHQRLGHPAAKIVNLVLDKPVSVDKRCCVLPVN